jgi:hypothetical protein
MKRFFSCVFIIIFLITGCGRSQLDNNESIVETQTALPTIKPTEDINLNQDWDKFKEYVIQKIGTINSLRRSEKGGEVSQDNKIMPYQAEQEFKNGESHEIRTYENGDVTELIVVNLDSCYRVNGKSWECDTGKYLMGNIKDQMLNVINGEAIYGGKITDKGSNISNYDGINCRSYYTEETIEAQEEQNILRNDICFSLTNYFPIHSQLVYQHKSNGVVTESTKTEDRIYDVNVPIEIKLPIAINATPTNTTLPPVACPKEDFTSPEWIIVNNTGTAIFKPSTENIEITAIGGNQDLYSGYSMDAPRILKKITSGDFEMVTRVTIPKNEKMDGYQASGLVLYFNSLNYSWIALSADGTIGAAYTLKGERENFFAETPIVTTNTVYLGFKATGLSVTAGYSVDGTNYIWSEPVVLDTSNLRGGVIVLSGWNESPGFSGVFDCFEIRGAK